VLDSNASRARIQDGRCSWALAMRPNVQRAAQRELENVVGPLRIPKPSDLEKLPYIRAIVVKEVSRWHSVNPLGMHLCVM
jgi:cytochrome P450